MSSQNLHFTRYRFAFLLLLLCMATSLYAEAGIGASIAAGSRFSVGGRLKYAFDHQFLPQPIFALTGTPLAKKRLHEIGESNYLQLREKNLYFDLGLVEYVGNSMNVRLEVELSYRMITGWYRGSSRSYEVQYSPVVAFGPVFHASEYTRNSIRFVWFQLNGKDCFAGNLILELHT